MDNNIFEDIKKYENVQPSEVHYREFRIKQSKRIVNLILFHKKYKLVMNELCQRN